MELEEIKPEKEVTERIKDKPGYFDQKTQKKRSDKIQLRGSETYFLEKDSKKYLVISPRSKRDLFDMLRGINLQNLLGMSIPNYIIDGDKLAFQIDGDIVSSAYDLSLEEKEDVINDIERNLVLSYILSPREFSERSMIALPEKEDIFFLPAISSNSPNTYEIHSSIQSILTAFSVDPHYVTKIEQKSHRILTNILNGSYSIDTSLEKEIKENEKFYTQIKKTIPFHRQSDAVYTDKITDHMRENPGYYDYDGIERQRKLREYYDI